MKRDLIAFAAIVAIVSFMWIATPAFAAEEVLTFKPSSVTTLTDKNGTEYGRMLMPVNGNKNGIAFTDTVAVNAFGQHVAAAKSIKPGQEVSAVVQKRDYQGKTYYTILGLKGEAQAKK